MGVLIDTSEEALKTSINKINNRKTRETFKDDREVPANEYLQSIFINGESQYAPNLLEKDKKQISSSLKHMAEDAFNGYLRSDDLDKSNKELDAEIAAHSADQKAQEKIKQQKVANRKNYKEETIKRDDQRAIDLHRIGGNTK